MKHTAVWIDHHKAQIFDYNASGVEHKTFDADLHGKMTPEQLRKYYHDLADILVSSSKVLLLGPGQAKQEFKNHCEDHHRKLNEAIVGIENMKDHASSEEILKASNQFFKKHFDWTGL